MFIIQWLHKVYIDLLKHTLHTFAVVTVHDTSPLLALIIVLYALITPLILFKRLFSAITAIYTTITFLQRIKFSYKKDFELLQYISLP